MSISGKSKIVPRREGESFGDYVDRIRGLDRYRDPEYEAFKARFAEYRAAWDAARAEEKRWKQYVRRQSKTMRELDAAIRENDQARVLQTSKEILDIHHKLEGQTKPTNLTVPNKYKFKDRT